MEADDAEVGSNDGDNNMPQLEASVEPQVDDEDVVEDENHDPDEEEEAEDEDEGEEGPALIMEAEPDENMEDEDEEEEGEAEEEAEVEEEVEEEGMIEECEEEDDEAVAQVEEEGVEDEEVGEDEVEQEEEEDEEEEEYENEGNPGEPVNNVEEGSNQDDEEDDKEQGQNAQVQNSRVKGGDHHHHHGHVMTRKRSASLSSSEEGPKRKQGRSASAASSSGEQQKGATDRTHDRYCWVCHKDGVYFNCKICPRSYHMRCICLPDYPEPTLPEGDGTSKVCICPECVVVMNAEEVDKRSEAMKQLSMDQLVSMLKQICGRMKVTPGAEPFLKPVQVTDACDYFDYIVYPMDIQTLEKNVKQRQYGSTEAFLADAQWIVHNSIIFNSSASPYTASAKRILKVCKQELSEIETCPECYTNAHTKSDTWFVEACKRPHILVWAKLKGFPFWPAKAMKIKDDQVDVRFFGQHDRAWVNLKDCFLYSEEMPAAPPKKNAALLSAIEELNTHIARLGETYGDVVLAKVKTPLGRELSTTEIQRLLPKYKPEDVPAKSSSDKEQTKSPKSGMTITISSIKTNPTIVNNSLSDTVSPTLEKKSKLTKRGSVSSVSETRPTTRSAKASSSISSGNTSEQDVSDTASETAADPPPPPPPPPPPAPAPAPAPPPAAATPVAPISTPTQKPTVAVVAVAPPQPPSTPTPPPPPPPPPTPPAKTEEPPKEEKKKKELVDDDFESRVPSGEILASALGLKRITRRTSQDTTASTPTPPPTKKEDVVPTPARKPTTTAGGESGEESDASSLNQLQEQLRKTSKVSLTQVDPLQVETPLPPVPVRIKSEPVEAPAQDESTEDFMEQQDEPEKVEVLVRSKAQDFMEHISTQAQTKPGYRFNISKDISISAIGQDTGSESDSNSSTGNAGGGGGGNKALSRKNFGLGSAVTVNATNVRPAVTVQQNSKPVPQLSTGSAGGGGGNVPAPITPRPKLAQALQQQQQQQQQQPLQQPQQRFLSTNKDIRSLTRMLKPAMSPASNKGPPMQTLPTTRPQRAVPGAIQMSALRGGSNSLLQKLAKDGSFKQQQQQPIVVDSTSLRVESPNHYSLNPGSGLTKVSGVQVNQSVQGAITLPGGTITVTPLSLQGAGNGSSGGGGGGGGGSSGSSNTYTNNSISINGDRSGGGVPLKAGGGGGNYSNGLPISRLDTKHTPAAAVVTAAPVLKTGKSPSSIGSAAARKVTNMVPPTVVQTVQNLQKNVNELIRVAAEAIAVDMVEHAASKTDGDKNYKLENDKLLMRHTKELTELRLSHEMMMRELRSNMETERKRALAELRRQMEIEKQKAVDEAKRKQWCAQCLREALFYCCWNTSYCGYSCQENHWPTHMATCTQNSTANNSANVENTASR